MSKTSHLADIVSALEGCWVDPEIATAEDVQQMLAERQRLLAGVQISDAQALPVEERVALFARVERIAERDRVLVEALQRKREALGKQLQSASKGRAAVRGYKATKTKIQPVLDRRG